MRPAASLAVGILVVAGLTTACSEPQPRPLPKPADATRPPLPLENGRLKIWPASAEVKQGVPYLFTLLTHCGLDHSVDFDASFWLIEEGDPLAEFDNPTDEGTMILLDTEHARFTSDGGGGIEFVRLEGSKDVLPCE